MPYARCPVCQGIFHIAVHGSLPEWEKQYVRERGADGVPLLKCIRCWVELRPGHRVIARSIPQELEGKLSENEQGIVLRGSTPEHPGVLVRFGNAEVELKREELHYVIGQPTVR